MHHLLSKRLHKLQSLYLELQQRDRFQYRILQSVPRLYCLHLIKGLILLDAIVHQ